METLDEYSTTTKPKIACIQYNIQWNRAEENRRHIEELMREGERADLYVLPEMWNTGFDTEEGAAAEDENGPSLSWMRETARRQGCALAGSMAIRDGEQLRNRFYFVHPDGRVEHYDKRHLFTPGGEHLRFTPGERRVVVNYMGVRMLLQVCYDLRFPVFSRNRGDYDIILYVASWPAVRIGVWNTLLCARAIENQCYVIGVNRIGKDPMCTYCGGTQCFDAYGRPVAESPRDAEHVLYITPDMKQLACFRRKFPVLEDADQ